MHCIAAIFDEAFREINLQVSVHCVERSRLTAKVSHPTLPYPTLPYPTLPYPTLPLPYPTLPYPTLPLPYPTVTLPYRNPTLPYRNPTLPYPTLRTPTTSPQSHSRARAHGCSCRSARFETRPTRTHGRSPEPEI